MPLIVILDSRTPHREPFRFLPGPLAHVPVFSRIEPAALENRARGVFLQGPSRDGRGSRVSFLPMVKLNTSERKFFSFLSMRYQRSRLHLHGFFHQSFTVWSTSGCAGISLHPTQDFLTGKRSGKISGSRSSASIRLLRWNLLAPCDAAGPASDRFFQRKRTFPSARPACRQKSGRAVLEFR